MPLVHIKSLPTLRGRTDFVTLNLILEQNRTSDGSWEESTLRSNPEVMNFFSKGKISFVSEEEYTAERKAIADRQAAASATIEDAVEEDTPAKSEAAVLAKQAIDILKRLEQALSGKAQPPAQAQPAKAAETPDKADGLDLPMSAPPGLRPQTTTEQYLKMAAAQKRKHLKECQDVGMLRDIALFEPDPKLKAAARKAAKVAEGNAELAERMAQAAAQ